MGFQAKVKEDALIMCARHCCLCERHKGLKIEVHHIKTQSEGGSDTLDNAIPLCFDCHGDMRTYDNKHPIGNNYSQSELIRRRDAWYQRVRSNGIVPPPEPSGGDQQIFNHAMAILPWNGSINFIRNNNFAGFPFDLDRLNDLHKFISECENPGFYFSDPHLEELRFELSQNIRGFLGGIGQFTHRVNGTTSHSSVPQEWETENPDYFDQAVSFIHDRAADSVQKYDELVRACRLHLGGVSLS